MKKLWMMAGIALLMTTAVASAAVRNGRYAPDFTLEDTYGKTHTLSDYRGQYVILEWFNHDCPFVRKHYSSGNMQRIQKKYTEQGIVWLSINSSAEGEQGYYLPKEANKLTRSKDAQPTAVLLDTDGLVGMTYGARTTPQMFIINPKGVLIYQGAIDSIASTNAMDVNRARNYVEQALDEAMAGKKVSVPTTKSYGCSVKY